MKNLRQRLRFVSLFMAFFLMVISVPYQPVLAAMVSTEEMVNSQRTLDAREYINTVLAREEIQNSLTSQGIDPLEAQARIDSLTDTEAIQLANRIDQVPAGGSAFGVIVGAAIIVFIVLVITDVLGYTDIFPFINS
ncbi:PA2779 family protein [Thermodesulfobacteriota bacterium]